MRWSFPCFSYCPKVFFEGSFQVSPAYNISGEYQVDPRSRKVFTPIIQGVASFSVISKVISTSLVGANDVNFIASWILPLELISSDLATVNLLVDAFIFDIISFGIEKLSGFALLWEAGIVAACILGG